MVMVVPLVMLALLSFVGGWVGIPARSAAINRFEHFLVPSFPLTHRRCLSRDREGGGAFLQLMLDDVSAQAVVFLGLWSLGVPVLLASGAARPHRRPRRSRLYRLVLNKYYVDEIYGAARREAADRAFDQLLWRH